MQDSCNVNQPNISVIVPVYKVEPYLRTCVDSILRQTYRDFELILVDDGSPDNCPAICDEYAAKYNFIKVIHKPNGGLSDARNAGMELAAGKYIAFIDSDDCVDEKYLEYLWEGIATTGAEMSHINSFLFHRDEELLNRAKDKKNIVVLDNKKALQGILYQITGDVNVWGLLLPAEVARAYPFPFGKLFEDGFVSSKYYLAVQKVGYVQYEGYYYRRRPGSITQQTMGLKHALDKIEAMECMTAACAGDEMIEKAARSKKFGNYCYILLNFPKIAEEAPSCYAKVQSFLEDVSFAIFKDSNCRIKKCIVGLGMTVFGVRFLDMIRWLYFKIKG